MRDITKQLSLGELLPCATDLNEILDRDDLHEFTSPYIASSNVSVRPSSEILIFIVTHIEGLLAAIDATHADDDDVGCVQDDQSNEASDDYTNDMNETPKATSSHDGCVGEQAWTDPAEGKDVKTRNAGVLERAPAGACASGAGMDAASQLLTRAQGSDMGRLAAHDAVDTTVQDKEQTHNPRTNNNTDDGVSSMDCDPHRAIHADDRSDVSYYYDCSSRHTWNQGANTIHGDANKDDGAGSGCAKDADAERSRSACPPRYAEPMGQTTSHATSAVSSLHKTGISLLAKQDVCADGLVDEYPTGEYDAQSENDERVVPQPCLLTPEQMYRRHVNAVDLLLLYLKDAADGDGVISTLCPMMESTNYNPVTHDDDTNGMDRNPICNAEHNNNDARASDQADTDGGNMLAVTPINAHSNTNTLPLTLRSNLFPSGAAPTSEQVLYTVLVRVVQHGLCSLAANVSPLPECTRGNESTTVISPTRRAQASSSAKTTPPYSTATRTAGDLTTGNQSSISAIEAATTFSSAATSTSMTSLLMKVDHLAPQPPRHDAALYRLCLAAFDVNFRWTTAIIADYLHATLTQRIVRQLAYHRDIGETIIALFGSALSAAQLMTVAHAETHLFTQAWLRVGFATQLVQYTPYAIRDVRCRTFFTFIQELIRRGFAHTAGPVVDALLQRENMAEFVPAVVQGCEEQMRWLSRGRGGKATPRECATTRSEGTNSISSSADNNQRRGANSKINEEACGASDTNNADNSDYHKECTTDDNIAGSSSSSRVGGRDRCGEGEDERSDEDRASDTRSTEDNENVVYSVHGPAPCSAIALTTLVQIFQLVRKSLPLTEGHSAYYQSGSITLHAPLNILCTYANRLAPLLVVYRDSIDCSSATAAGVNAHAVAADEECDTDAENRNGLLTCDDFKPAPRMYAQKRSYTRPRRRDAVANATARQALRVQLAVCELFTELVQCGFAETDALVLRTRFIPHLLQLCERYPNSDGLARCLYTVVLTIFERVSPTLPITASLPQDDFTHASATITTTAAAATAATIAIRAPGATNPLTRDSLAESFTLEENEPSMRTHSNRLTMCGTMSEVDDLLWSSVLLSECVPHAAHVPLETQLNARCSVCAGACRTRRYSRRCCVRPSHKSSNNKNTRGNNDDYSSSTSSSSEDDDDDNCLPLPAQCPRVPYVLYCTNSVSPSLVVHPTMRLFSRVIDFVVCAELECTVVSAFAAAAVDEMYSCLTPPPPPETSPAMQDAHRAADSSVCDDGAIRTPVSSTHTNGEEDDTGSDAYRDSEDNNEADEKDESDTRDDTGHMGSEQNDNVASSPPHGSATAADRCQESTHVRHGCATMEQICEVGAPYVRCTDDPGSSSSSSSSNGSDGMHVGVGEGTDTPTRILHNIPTSDTPDLDKDRNEENTSSNDSADETSDSNDAAVSHLLSMSVEMLVVRALCCARALRERLRGLRRAITGAHFAMRYSATAQLPRHRPPINLTGIFPLPLNDGGPRKRGSSAAIRCPTLTITPLSVTATAMTNNSNRENNSYSDTTTRFCPNTCIPANNNSSRCCTGNDTTDGNNDNNNNNGSVLVSASVSVSSSNTPTKTCATRHSGIAAALCAVPTLPSQCVTRRRAVATAESASWDCNSAPTDDRVTYGHMNVTFSDATDAHVGECEGVRDWVDGEAMHGVNRDDSAVKTTKSPCDAAESGASVWRDRGQVETWGSSIVQSYPHFADIQLGFDVHELDVSDGCSD